MTLKEMIGDPTPKDLRIFAALQIAFFAILSATLLKPWLSFNGKVALIAISMIVGILGLIQPAWIRKIYVGWMVLVFPIGWTISHLCMAVVYFLVVTPIGLFRRTMHGDPMQRNFQEEKTSYWEPRKINKSSENYFRQF